MPVNIQMLRDIDRCFTARQYDRAVNMLRALVLDNPSESSLKLKLSDAYFLQGDSASAVDILRNIAIEYARDGFITKAIAVQKKIERIDPSAAMELFKLMEEGQKPALPIAAEPVENTKPDATETAPPVESDPRERALDRLFKGLSREDLMQIVTRLDERSFPGGTIVFREGDSDTGVFIIVQGSVQILLMHHEREVELARLGEGNFFGEVALLTGKPRTASVRCAEDTTFLVLDRPQFLSLSEQYPVLQESLSAALEMRAQSAIERLLEIERSH